MSRETIERAARAIEALGPALLALEECPGERRIVAAAVGRGWFAPEESDRLRAWFARYLTARSGLREVVADLRPLVEAKEPMAAADRTRCFVLGYASACLLVRAARFLVFDLARSRVVQRKLNEPDPDRRIPGKQYTRIRRAVTDPLDAWRLREAMRHADRRREAIADLEEDPELAPAVACLRRAEPALDVGLRTLIRARLLYRWHAWRRRNARAWQQVLFGAAEAGGRLIADVRDPLHRHRATPEVRRRIAELLRPGDVVVTRHDRALSNLFLPGYWPHAMLHLGPPGTAARLGIETTDERRARWDSGRAILEARKDGVLLREVDDSLAVDAIAVLRPRIAEPLVALAIARALRHEGKLYNFDFDFFTDDRLVCTEVVYRAYDGVGEIAIALASRAGRPTLSSEDLVTIALEGGWLAPAVLYGAPGAGEEILLDEAAAEGLDRIRRTAIEPPAA